ncbi:hypothetical protein G3I51_23885 [Streptomyces sp. SID9944]|nr:hypothetical protein [Streptomyces sp. SID9944]
MSARLSPEREAEIAARAEAATKGPWGYYDGETYADVAADLQITGRGSYSYREKVARLEDENYWDDAAHEEDDEERASEQMAANAAFIAHARTDVPALLAELAAVRAERDQAQAELSEYERMNQQQCRAGKHADWLVDSEFTHACPWCQIEALKAQAAEAGEVR